VLAIAGVVAISVAPAAQAQPGSQCDPNYSGACVPIASDVDCQGGGGNGPAYVRGPVTVVGTDIYDLDRDGNGTGCEG
jgi:resuscitation-promoting factor RpfB